MANEERAVEIDFDLVSTDFGIRPTDYQDILEGTEGDVGSNELDIYIDGFPPMAEAKTSDDVHGICLSPTSTSCNTSRAKRLTVPSSFECLDDSHKRKREDLQNLVESGQIRIWIKEPTDSFCGRSGELNKFISIMATMNALGLSDDAINFGNKYMKLLDGAFGTTSCEEILRMGDHLGQAYINCREWNNAQNLYRRIERRSVELLGRTHSTTRHITNNLAYSLMISGKFEESMEMYTNTYRTNDPNDLHDLNIKIRLAMVQKCLGNYELYVKMLRDGFDGAVFGLNDGHLLSLTIKHSLDLIHILTNVFKKWFEFLKEYTQYKELKYGLNSKTPETNPCLAEALAELGDLVKAHRIEDELFSDSPEKGIGKSYAPFYQLQLYRAKLNNELGSMHLEGKVDPHIKMLRAKLTKLLLLPSGLNVIRQEQNVLNILFGQRKYQKINQMRARELDEQLRRWSGDQPVVKSTQGLIEECTTALGNLGIQCPHYRIDLSDYEEEIEERTESKSELEREYGEGTMTLTRYQCHICDAGFENKKTLTRHLKYDHSGIIFPCELCGKEYTRPDRVLRHKAKVHAQRRRRKIR